MDDEFRPYYAASTFAGVADYPPIDAGSSLHRQASLRTLPTASSSTPPNSFLSATSFHLTTLPADIGVLAVNLNFLYAASGHQIHVYDVNANFTLIDTFNNRARDYSSSGSVKAITFLTNRVFTAHQDGKISFWKFSSGKRHKLVTAIPTWDDRLFRSMNPSNHKTVRGHKRKLWIEHYDAVSGLCFTEKGCLISASWDGSFKIWNENDYRCLKSIKGAHDDAINALVVASDGVIFTASADHKIKVWAPAGSGDQISYSVLATLGSHQSPVNALALSADQSVLFSGSADGSILVWRKDGGPNYMSVIGTLSGHSGAVLCLVSISHLLISGSEDRTVRVWRPGPDGRYGFLAVFDGHATAVRSLAATAVGCGHGGLKVISGSSDGMIKVWHIVISSC